MATGVLVRTSNGSLYLFKNGLKSSIGKLLDSGQTKEWRDKLIADGSWLPDDKLDEANAGALKNIGQIIKVTFDVELDDEVVPTAGDATFDGS